MEYTLEDLIYIHNRLLIKYIELKDKEDVNQFILQVLEEEIKDLRQVIDNYYK